MYSIKELASRHLRTEIDAEIDHQFSKGRVLSTLDVGYYLDHTLEVYEDEHGDCIPAEEFEVIVESICGELLHKKLVYLAGNRESFIENVRSLGLIARQEATMRKAISTEGEDGWVHKTIFRDTEFPYNESTGMYIV